MQGVTVPAPWSSFLSPDYGLPLEVEFHLDAGQFYHIVVVQLMRLIHQRLAVHQWKTCPFDMGDEETLRATGEYRHLQTRFTQCCEVLYQLELLAGIRPGQNLHRSDL